MMNRLVRSWWSTLRIHALGSDDSRSTVGDPGEFVGELLQFAVARHASDIHLATGKRPILRIHGVLRSINLPTLRDGEVGACLDTLMNDAQREQWKTAGRCVFMHTIAKLARFRIRMFTQHQGVGAAIRILPHEVPRLDTLGPPRGDQAVSGETGIIIIAGPSGCGRTTMLASMLLAIGSFEPKRMVSIGRPLEFDMADRLPDLIQIDLTQTTGGYPAAIREASGAGTKVIAVDDASDPATMIEALRAAQQGCLVLCGLRATNTRFVLEEIIGRCPKGEETGRRLLADTLRAVFCQHWIFTVGGGRILAFEVALGTPSLKNCIRQFGMAFAFYSLLQTHGQLGFQTFDQDVQRLLREGRISHAEAASHLLNADAAGGRGGDLTLGLVPSEDAGAAPAIPSGVFAPEALDDPKVFEHVARYREGLIIISGPPASGRSVTAAYLLSLIMAKWQRHIVTLECRVEHAFEEGMDGRGLVTRHVLPTSPVDLADAVSAALGEDPDVLFLAVEPDAAALMLLLDAAHSGMLVVIVLPARSPVAAIEYLRDRIPASERAKLYYEYKLDMLRAAFAQRLVPQVGGGRVAVYEILVGTPAVRNIIRERRFDQLQSCMMGGQPYGQTFAKHLARLVEAGTVSANDARLDEI